MKYAVDKGPVVIMYIPGFMKTGSYIQKLLGGGIYSDTRAGIFRSSFVTVEEKTLVVQ
jgi:hypothetical protein